MTSRVRDLHEQNRQAWNEGAEAYEAELSGQIEFLRSGGISLLQPELDFLGGLSEWCRRAVHLQCAGGTDSLSLWNLGAGEVFGVDISEKMLDVARAKSEALQVPAQWIRCDVLDAPTELDGTADLVYTGKGALCWLHDLERWASVVHRLLRPGGKFYLFDGHPISAVWDENSTEYRLHAEYGDYFSQKALSTRGWPETYIGNLGKEENRHSVKHERQWTLGDILNPLLNSGLRLLRLEEHPILFWNSLPRMDPETRSKMPHTISLWMERQV